MITLNRRFVIASLSIVVFASSCARADIELDADATAVSANHRHGCAVITDGAVECWGENRYSQLGDGTTDDAPDELRRVTDVAQAVQLAAGEDFTCAIVAEGAVRCWGFNLSGQVGDGATYTLSSARTPVPGVAGAISVAAGRSHACAALADGSVRCWGGNDSGQLGDGTRTDQLVPVTVPGIDDAVALSAGTNFTCALVADGSVTCWGVNGLGQLGNGSRTDSAEPTSVRGLDDVVALDSQLAMTCAIRADGSVWCWGTGGHGDPGIETAPIRIAGVSGASKVAVGEQASCALVDGGTRCWRGTSRAWAESATTQDVVDVAMLGPSLCTLGRDGKITCSTTR